MSSLTDPVKILARRFASLPPSVRLAIVEKMLRWRDEESKEVTEPRATSCGVRRKSLLEQFWEEVERAHGDDLYLDNPFADQSTQTIIYAPDNNPERCLAF